MKFTSSGGGGPSRRQIGVPHRNHDDSSDTYVLANGCFYKSSFIYRPQCIDTSLASELLVNQLWYRTKAKIEWLLYGSPEAPTAHWSPVTELPQELVEMVISYFVHDTPSLLACSMTCYSWYIAAVPHLHHTLTTDNDPFFPTVKDHPWPKPLQKSYKLGLLPFVKKLRIRSGICRYRGFTSEWLNKHTLLYFSALTNLQELGIDYLQVSSSMPTFRQSFGHFSPTLRFLALREPAGSCRQILYFIGLFPSLQDLKFVYRLPTDEQESTADATLVPISTPPLRGRLILACFTREGLIKDMIALFGGLRFRYMDLFKVKCVPLLLRACAETLETLKLYPTDSPGQEFPNRTRGQFVAIQRALLRHFNLSQNKSLRTLETTAEAINAAAAASDFFKTVLSSTASPTPLDIVVVYRELDFINMPHCSRCDSEAVRLRRYWRGEKDWCVLFLLHHFRVFRRMHSARDFRLVLCADVFDCMAECCIETLERVVEAEKATGRLDYLPQMPLVIFERRTLRTHYTSLNAGWTGSRAVTTNAL